MGLLRIGPITNPVPNERNQWVDADAWPGNMAALIDGAPNDQAFKGRVRSFLNTIHAKWLGETNRWVQATLLVWIDAWTRDQVLQIIRVFPADDEAAFPPY